MNLVNELNSLGVNTEEALKRFMNNSSLYERMLKKLPKNVESCDVMSYLEVEDYSKALENAHTLKGVMGNLSITPLYTAYTDIVALLRENNPSQAKMIMQETLPIQKEILSCIERNQ